MNWGSFFLGVIATPVFCGLVLFFLVAFSRTTQIDRSCGYCEQAGFRNAYVDMTGWSALRAGAFNWWHKHVTARRKAHRIQWQKSYDALSEKSYRRNMMSKSESKYGVR